MQYEDLEREKEREVESWEEYFDCRGRVQKTL
jgi:hypothetical protein